MLLSDKDLKDIKAGNRVRSRATGNLGTIIGISDAPHRPESPIDCDNDYWIEIQWESGKKSYYYQCNLVNVEEYDEIEQKTL